jgi:ribosome maturation factor RimP
MYISFVVEIARNGLFLFHSSIPMDIRLQEVVEESAKRHGAQCVDLIVRGHAGRAVVEVFVDNESGITTELCAAISRDIASAVDQRGILAGSYRLEVSSPGIDRPLRHAWQYPKHVGRRLLIRRKGAAGTEELRGTLKAADGTAAQLAQEGVAETLSIPFEEILEARVQAPW